ncbi:MAG: FAD-dependent oxidoreductase, partial [Spirochaetia bacterium]|nr:FAD-dependent oxidoreductase [Spirochaetia bacterium]
KKAVIIGGGNVAIDTARSLWRIGADVTVVYRRAKEDMPANKSEIDEAHAEGIKFMFMTNPVRITGSSDGSVEAIEIMKMEGGQFDLSGRRKPVETGNISVLPCDIVVIAVGEKVDSALLEQEKILTTEKGTAFVNPYTCKTGNPRIYAAGDVTTGPSTAAEAMGLAKTASAIIDFDLTGKNRFSSLFRTFQYSNEIPQEIISAEGIESRHLNVKERKGNFQEINLGYMGDQARREAMRCLRCDIKLSERGGLR